MNRILCASVFLIAFSTPIFAQVIVKDPWLRATVPQQKVTGAFMQLTSSQDARLIEARSAAAGAVELHEMTMEKNVMKMRAVSGVDLPAGKTVELKPGGYHLMLTGLKQQMKVGEAVPMTLIVEGKDKKRDAIEIKVPVRPLTATGMPEGEHKH